MMARVNLCNLQSHITSKLAVRSHGKRSVFPDQPTIVGRPLPRGTNRCQRAPLPVRLSHNASRLTPAPHSASDKLPAPEPPRHMPPAGDACTRAAAWTKLADCLIIGMRHGQAITNQSPRPPSCSRVRMDRAVPRLRCSDGRVDRRRARRRGKSIDRPSSERAHRPHLRSSRHDCSSSKICALRLIRHSNARE